MVSLVLGFGSTEGLFNRHRKKGSSRAKEGQQPGGKGKGAKKGKVSCALCYLWERRRECAQQKTRCSMAKICDRGMYVHISMKS